MPPSKYTPEQNWFSESKFSTNSTVSLENYLIIVYGLLFTVRYFQIRPCRWKTCRKSYFIHNLPMKYLTTYSKYSVFSMLIYAHCSEGVFISEYFSYVIISQGEFLGKLSFSRSYKHDQYIQTKIKFTRFSISHKSVVHSV